MSGYATINTMFWRLIGQEQVNITASGEVVWGIKKLNLALAFDNTGSMSSNGKMTELKEAAHNLLDTLKKPRRRRATSRSSIVPFAVDVNVGTSNVNADWIDWERLGSQERHLQQVLIQQRQSSCTSNNGTWTPKTHSIWNGCVMDRDQNNDVHEHRDRPPAVRRPCTARTRPPHCPTAMMPLSSDWTALERKIDAMMPTGNTNVTIGLQMAWQTLVEPMAPFNAPAPLPISTRSSSC